MDHSPTATDRWALDHLEQRCRQEPGSVVGSLLAALRRRPDAIAEALDGAGLRVRLAIDGPHRVEAWIVFSSDGHVAVLGGEAVNESRSAPDLLLRGQARSILAALLGLIDSASALNAGVLLPMAPSARLDSLLMLVGRELLALVEDYTEA
ncbi:MAG: hypothetical protein M3394_01130 [Actinomycetota bacterium]|nr:hypothetical protein [Actinomycetota bacterium]